jgi:hypothetical protein
MTKVKVIEQALEALEWCEPHCDENPKGFKKWAAVMPVLREALRIEQSQPTAQAQLLHMTIQSAVNLERENCARLCDQYGQHDMAEAIRARGHQ